MHCNHFSLCSQYVFGTYVQWHYEGLLEPAEGLTRSVSALWLEFRSQRETSIVPAGVSYSYKGQSQYPSWPCWVCCLWGQTIKCCLPPTVPLTDRRHRFGAFPAPGRGARPRCLRSCCFPLFVCLISCTVASHGIRQLLLCLLLSLYGGSF